MTPTNSEFTGVLVVDDEQPVCDFVADVMQEMGLAAAKASSFADFHREYEADPTRVIILDLHMPDRDGIEYLRFLKDEGCTTGIVLMSGTDRRVLQTAQNLGRSLGLNIIGALQKPVEIEAIEALFRDAAGPGEEITAPALETAVNEGQLFLQYHPKVQLGPGATDPASLSMLNLAGQQRPVESVEALVRWKHPRLGRLDPGRFLPLAESSGLMEPLTSFVVDEALRQLRLWDEAGLALTVAINYPPHLTEHLELPDQMLRVVNEAGVSPDRVILEITETGALNDTVTAMDVLSRIRLKRFRLSMDDFGTGHSSVIQLHRMPFSELKLDQSIIMELSSNSEAYTITRSMIDLAHNMGLAVCAEGVETKEILSLLKELKCDTVQGFLFGKPMSGNEILERWTGGETPTPGRNDA